MVSLSSSRIVTMKKFLITNSLRLIKQKFYLTLSYSHQTPTFSHPLRHKTLQDQKEFNFCSFSDASSSSTIYHPLWVNWEKHTRRWRKKTRMLKRLNVHWTILESCWSRKNSGSMKILQQSFKIKFSNSHSLTHTHARVCRREAATNVCWIEGKGKTALSCYRFFQPNKKPLYRRRKRCYIHTQFFSRSFHHSNTQLQLYFFLAATFSIPVFYSH